MAKLNLPGKSLSKLNKQKKNILIWILLGSISFAFVLAIYNGIDVDGAIKAQEIRNKVLENPDMTDKGDEASTKISWAINMENTISNLESEQERMVINLTEKTKKEIIASNSLLLLDFKKANQKLNAKLDLIQNDNRKLTRQITALQEKTNSNISALNSKLIQQTSDMKNLIEEGVMLPPPPIQLGADGKKENKLDEDSLFGKIEKVIPFLKQTAKSKPVESYEILSYSNKLSDINDTEQEISLTEEELKKLNTFEIVTGFTDGFLLTGAYAPLFGGSGGGSRGGSGGASQSVPVLIETQGDLVMPNHTIGSIDKCFILGVTSGNAGARTVEIRLDKMTCLLGDGTKIMSGKIEGYVVSESGTAGLPATLIYKAGDFISRMIGAGVLEGLSTAVVNSAASFSNTGTRDSINYSSGIATGTGTGMSNAFTKLSEFYLQLAEATLPILEVKPGRFVSLVLVGGNQFELKDVNLLDTREVDSYVNEFIGE